MCHGFSLGTTGSMARSDVIATAPSASPITRGAAANSLHPGTASDMRLPGSGLNTASWTDHLVINIVRARHTLFDNSRFANGFPSPSASVCPADGEAPGSRPGAAAGHGTGTWGRSLQQVYSVAWFVADIASHASRLCIAAWTRMTKGRGAVGRQDGKYTMM